MIVTSAIIYQTHIPAIFKTSWKTLTVKDPKVYTWSLGEYDQQIVPTHRNSHGPPLHQPTDVSRETYDSKCIMAFPLSP